MLDRVFSNMWRPTSELDGDELSVDITHLEKKFQYAFIPFLRHDAYKFLIHMMNGLIRETVDPEVFKKWKKDEKNYDVIKFSKTGVLNQSFAMLSGASFRCKKGHESRKLSSSLFLNLHTLGGVRSLDELCRNEFGRKKAHHYCRECGEEVRGTYRRKLVTLPKTLFIVVDRFDSGSHLKNLLSAVPKSLDLWDHLNEENQDMGVDTKYLLSGFICQDPIHLDYSTYLANKKREAKNQSHDWTCFSKRGIGKLSDATLFEGNSLPHNAQILLYKKVVREIKKSD